MGWHSLWVGHKTINQSTHLLNMLSIHCGSENEIVPSFVESSDGMAITPSCVLAKDLAFLRKTKQSGTFCKITLPIGVLRFFTFLKELENRVCPIISGKR